MGASLPSLPPQLCSGLVSHIVSDSIDRQLLFHQQGDSILISPGPSLRSLRSIPTSFPSTAQATVLTTSEHSCGTYASTSSAASRSSDRARPLPPCYKHRHNVGRHCSQCSDRCLCCHSTVNISPAAAAVITIQ